MKNNSFLQRINTCKLVFMTLFMSIALFSCSNDALDFGQDEIDESSLILKSETVVLPDSLGAILDIEETEESKVLKELFEKTS
ncbi:hypothetical protein FACS1894169_04890 [Bacteroidia bacterium]|nr:hypothetical protein FACS1894169_04890 [Bacteroidia bacterium]